MKTKTHFADWHRTAHFKGAWLKKAVLLRLCRASITMSVGPLVGGLFWRKPWRLTGSYASAGQQDSFLEALAEDFRQGGAEAIAKVRKEHPAAYIKILALLVPKELKVETVNRLGQMTDEQLDAAIAMLEVIERKAGERATLIEGKAEVVPSLPTPAKSARDREAGALHAFRPQSPFGRNSRQRIASGVL